MGRTGKTSRGWVPFCGLTPPVGLDRSGGRSTGGPPWSLRSATDRRIVPSSRSPNLERSPLHLSEGRSREVQTDRCLCSSSTRKAKGVARDKGVYETWIVPRLLDLAMRNRLLGHYRQRTI